MIQLNPPLWLKTPKGDGLAHFVIAEWEHDLYWVVFLQSGEIWTFANPEVRAADNKTIGRVKSPIPEGLRAVECSYCRLNGYPTNCPYMGCPYKDPIKGANP